MFEENPVFTPYHYCSNNPINRVDPTGELDEKIYVSLYDDPPKKKNNSNVKTTQTPPKQDFSGTWGIIKYIWTGGNINGYSYNMDGEVIGVAPTMGLPPDIGIGTIGPYNVLTKITKGSKGAIQAHHLIEARHLKRLLMSTKDAPSVIITKADHLKMTKALRELLPYSKKPYTKAEIINAYKKAYSKYPEWIEIVTKYLSN